MQTHRPAVLLLALLIVIALQGPIHWFNNPSSPDRMITGSDSFMRLQRVVDLHTTGNWYNPYQGWTNAPYGETLHWTRPMDALLYAGAWIGSQFGDFSFSLVLWGAIVSPVLLLATVLVWSWATRMLLDDTAFLLGVAMMVLLPTLDAVYKLGRPDHHSLLMFLFFSQMAVFIRIALGHDSPRLAAAGGVFCSLALWVSVESLSHLAFFAGALGIYWLWQGGTHLRTMSVYLWALAITTVLALAAERPPDQWLTVQYDRISIVHVVLTFAGALGWAMVLKASRNGMFRDNVKGRTLAATAACAVPAVVMLALFPRFFYGPFVDIASDEFSQWIADIAEYQPLVPVDRYSTGMFIAHLGPALITAVFGYLRWGKADVKERRLWILWGIGLAIFVPAALDAIRWSMYVQAIVWLPWALAIIALARRSWVVSLRRIRLPVNAVLTPVLVLGPVLTAMAILPAKEAEAAKEACDWPGIAQHLRTIRQAEGSRIVFSHLFLGPELVWRSGHRVVGAPYGNRQALGDTNKLFRTESVETALEIVTRRKVDFIMICPQGPERRRYVFEGQHNFFGEIGDGRTPPWLKAEDLPPELARSFKLYRVIR